MSLLFNYSIYSNNARPSTNYFENIFEPLNYHVQSEKELKDFPKFAKVAICLKGEQYKNGFEQKTYEVQDLEKSLELYRDAENCYITSNQFSYGRSEKRLCNLVMLSCDLDTYKTEIYKDTTHEKLINDVKAVCLSNGLPFPTIMYSGNGYYLKWIFKEKQPVFQLSKKNRKGKYRTPLNVEKWKIAQRVINKLFEDFGSDTKALDVARLLRLCGTINGKTGKRAELLEVHENQSFDYMLQVLEPHTEQEDLDKILGTKKEPKPRVLKDVQPVIKKAMSLPVANEEKQKPNVNFIAKNTRSLAKARYEDLLKLIEMRGDVTGERINFTFWICNFMCATGRMNYAEFRDQAEKIGQKVFRDKKWRFTDLSTLENRVRQYNLEMSISAIKHNEYIPLYTPRNTKLINIFSITDEEQKHLKTIISDDEKRRRDKEKKELLRREKGMKKQEGESKSQPWIELGISRRTYYTKKKNGLI
ncbi:hypothetical protein [Pseudomonas aeruginosa]|uniref:hypothetical protein n=1 Tax=Pseudomonas aeruginosa TaxID=287 RepID=UPI0021DABE4A|nr:hypothetical protein [Pseudomonas aeruginosa]HEJ3365499.1 hypothetical protein [Pseudomonas aeruginosa]